MTEKAWITIEGTQRVVILQQVRAGRWRGWLALGGEVVEAWSIEEVVRLICIREIDQAAYEKLMGARDRLFEIEREVERVDGVVYRLRDRLEQAERELEAAREEDARRRAVYVELDTKIRAAMGEREDVRTGKRCGDE